MLNYNSSASVISCIQSFKSVFIDAHHELIVVDNGDVESESLALFCKDLDNIHYIRTFENLGYAKGNNVGIIKAYNLFADFVFIMNPDVHICFDDFLTNIDLLNNFDKDVAVISFNIDGVSQYTHYNSLLGTIFPYFRRFKDKSVKLTEKQRIARFHGCFFCITREYLTAIKCEFFDESTFLYFEEDLASQKIHDKKYKIIYSSALSVTHEGSVSVNASFPIKKYIFMYASLSHLINVVYLKRIPFSIFFAKILAFTSIFIRVITDFLRGY
jgi:GT2 family glycosyltransferase